ncbi:MAG: HoxN/HupN/NixA family nickel/cobalt transporter [Gemmatimonadales bacterium]
MVGLDDWIAGLGGNGLMALVVALLLGLRHATDPDHLTAVSALILSDQRDGARRAGALGLAWGLGHATTLLAFGLPVVLFRRYLPEGLIRGAEVAIGLVIIVLALRLLFRWAQGYFHIHSHSHDGVQHSHPHVHEGRRASHPAGHIHPHAQALGRSPMAAFGIGMVHGIGGSAGVGILVVGAASSQVTGVTALVLFALATALSMALVSSCFGYALARGSVARRAGSLIPALALASLVFGAWYTLEAVRGLPLF